MLFLPFHCHHKDEKKAQQKSKATILSIDNHMVYHGGVGFILPSLSKGTVEKNVDLFGDIDDPKIEITESGVEMAEV